LFERPVPVSSEVWHDPVNLQIQDLDQQLQGCDLTAKTSLMLDKDVFVPDHTNASLEVARIRCDRHNILFQGRHNKLPAVYRPLQPFPEFLEIVHPVQVPIGPFCNLTPRELYRAAFLRDG
jgi:hypothetical protein